MYTLYGKKGSGSATIEAALTMAGAPYRMVETASWETNDAFRDLLKINPIGQIPTLALSDGSALSESAAILIHLADAHPGARLAPPVGDPRRAQYLRWMAYVSSAIYALFWIKGDPMRIAAGKEDVPRVIDRVHDRIAACWAAMDRQITPGRYILGDALTVLDLYVTVVSRFGPWRSRFYQTAPKMAEIVRRVDADPRLKDFWARRYPFEEGWER